MGIRLGVVLALVLLAAGCGDEAADDGDVTARTVPQLDGTVWVATSVTEDGTPRALVPGSEIRIEFRDATISISGGCNGLGGDYTLSTDGELSTGTLSGTMMACAQPLMDQDAWLSGTVFAEPLVAAADGNTLVLAREGLEIVLADRGVAAPDAALEGTVWQLDGVQSGETATSVPAGTVATLTIAEDGTAAVDTGCNRGSGPVSRSGSTLSFGPVAVTRMACADDAGREAEAAQLAVLDGDVEWSVSERTLTLTKGERGLTYRVTR